MTLMTDITTVAYTLPTGAAEKDWELEVLLNGKHVVGGSFAIEVLVAISSFEIAGATGLYGAVVNGIFEKTEEIKNGNRCKRGQAVQGWCAAGMALMGPGG